MTREWPSDAANARIIEIARKYSLDSGKLKSVIVGRCRGLSNHGLAVICGINRNTVGKYDRVLGNMEEKEIYELLYLIGKIGFGVE